MGVMNDDETTELPALHARYTKGRRGVRCRGDPSSHAAHGPSGRGRRDLQQLLRAEPNIRPQLVQHVHRPVPHVWGQRTLMTLLKPEHRGFFRDLKDAGYRNAVFGHNDLLAQESIPLSFDEVTPRVKPDPPDT